MFPAKIEQYLRPHSIEEALEAIAGYAEGEAIFLAGGQSVMQAMKARMLRPRCIVDLQDIDELKGIEHDEEGLKIGAMTRYVDIAKAKTLEGAFSALHEATSHVGDRQVRNRGTIGGSLCWNYTSSCTPATVLALDGQINLLGPKGVGRSLAADDFLLGALETARAEDEILLSVSWFPPPRWTGSAYKKWGQIKDALPVVGICVKITLNDSGSCDTARIALTGLADGAQRALDGESNLIGSDGGDTAIENAMKAIAESTETHSDLSASAAYRKHLIRTLGVTVVKTAFERARQN